MRMALNVVVAATGLLLAFLGVQWMFAPDVIAQSGGVGLGTQQAFNTARGSVGGPLLANTVLCALGLWTGYGRWLLASAIVIAGVMVGRIVGIALDGAHQTSLVAVFVELFMIVCLVLAGRQRLGT